MRSGTRKSPTPLILIDGDPIVYRCGFAAETPWYNVTVEDVEDNVTVWHFEPEGDNSAGQRMNDWIDAHPELRVIDKERGANPQPLAFALRAVTEQLNSIVRECEKHLGKKCNVVLYLSGQNNYRDKLATIKPYKGNRDAAHKPVHFAAIREYLIKQRGAKVIHGREADDEVSIVARKMARDKLPFIVATIDKDLDQIPGQHYNYRKKVHYTVDHEEALAWFYVQCLSGDPTDNIPGCYRCGPAKAQKIVNDALCESEHLDAAEQEAWLWAQVVEAYGDSQKVPGCPYADKDAEAVALETARLVKMQEYESQLWNPPGVPDELL